MPARDEPAAPLATRMQRPARLVRRHAAPPCPHRPEPQPGRRRTHRPRLGGDLGRGRGGGRPGSHANGRGGAPGAGDRRRRAPPGRADLAGTHRSRRRPGARVTLAGVLPPDLDSTSWSPCGATGCGRCPWCTTPGTAGRRTRAPGTGVRHVPFVVACGDGAADDLRAAGLRKPVRVLRHVVALPAAMPPAHRSAVRQAVGCGPDTLLIGMAGRHVAQKHVCQGRAGAGPAGAGRGRCPAGRRRRRDRRGWPALPAPPSRRWPPRLGVRRRLMLVGAGRGCRPAWCRPMTCS